MHSTPAGHPLREAKPPPAIETLLTVSESAETLRVCTKTVKRLIARGELRVVRLGSSVRIAPAALRELIARGGEA
jgi:excisionase family DNA binding protein